MSQILFHSPGQQVSIILETLDGYQRADGYAVPYISRILFPNLSSASGYPKPMTRLSTGLHIFNFTLPNGAAAVGSYIVDITWYDPHTGGQAQTFYQIIVTAPFGSYGITAG